MPFLADKSDFPPSFADGARPGLTRGRWTLVREIFAILLGLASLLTLLALISAARQLTPESNWIGTLGFASADKLFFVFGRYIAFVLPVMVGLCALHALRGADDDHGPGRGWLRGLGGLMILIATCALLALSVLPTTLHYNARAFEMGGLVGNMLIAPSGLNLVQPLGRLGAGLLLGTCSIIGLILFTEKLLRDLFGLVWRLLGRTYQWLGELGIYEWFSALLPAQLGAFFRRIFSVFGFLGRFHLLRRIRHYFDGLAFRPETQRRVLRGGTFASGSILELNPRPETARGLAAPEDEAWEEEEDEKEIVPAMARRAAQQGRSSSVFGGAARTAQRFEAPVGDETEEEFDETEGEYSEYDENVGDWDEQDNSEIDDRDDQPPALDPEPEGQLDLLGEFESPIDEAILRRQKRKRRNRDDEEESSFLPRPYRLPSLELLADPSLSVWEMSEEEQQRLSQRIEQTLAQFKIEVQVIEVIQGPVITRFALKVAPGVRVNKILALENELAMALKAQHVRILAPIPGQAAVGIEVPNKKANSVLLKELLESPTFQNCKSPLSFALGKNIAGEPIVCDLAQMPHLLIAGATGSGKSVCLNSIIASLLYRNKPDRVKFIMIDPKRVELSIYQAIPHLIAPVVSENKKAAAALAWCVEQMEQRYKLLAEIGVRNLDGYNALLNEKTPNKKTFGRELKFLPQIVIIIDELADLMMVARNEVEEYIIRLAQMARAVGMHLVLATQRPSVNVITGIIKANFPSRIAFQVSSKVDSRTILDMNGAEALLGRGDMLYSPGGAKPFRIQGCFVSDAEVERLADFIRGQEKARYEKDDFEARPTPAERAKANLNIDGSEVDGEESDELHPMLRNRGEALDMPGLAAAGRAGMAPLTPADMESLSDEMLYDMALKIVFESRKGSVSYIQRRLKIGYARAGRIMDIMEERGIVGPYQGSKPRDVLVDPKEYMARNSS